MENNTTNVSLDTLTINGEATEIFFGNLDDLLKIVNG
tara:strand:- start:3144 stop:3254 length:111 start_codon:yes stop_codon:yes gene_type:complete